VLTVPFDTTGLNVERDRRARVERRVRHREAATPMIRKRWRCRPGMVSDELRVGCEAFASATREPGACMRSSRARRSSWRSIVRGTSTARRWPGETLVKYARSR
jgi:hypothetical protein